MNKVLRPIVLVALFGVLVLAGRPSIAQDVVAPSSPIDLQVSDTTKQDIQRFRQLLADPGIQAWLQQAEPVATDVVVPRLANSRMLFSVLLDTIHTRLGNLHEATNNMLNAPAQLLASWKSQMSHAATYRVINFIIIFLFVGAALEWLYAQFTRIYLLDLEFSVPKTLRQRITTACLRALVTLGGVLVFAMGSIGAFLGFQWRDLIRETVLDILIVVLVVRLVSISSRFFLAPGLQELRLVPFTNRQAKGIHFWVVLIVLLGVMNGAVASIAARVVAMSANTAASSAALSVELAANLFWMLAAVVAIWTIWLLFGDGSSQDSRENHPPRSRFWPIYLSLLALLTMSLWIVGTNRLMWSLLIVGSLLPLIHLFQNWVNHLFDQAELKGTPQGLWVSPPNSGALVEDVETEPDATESSNIASTEPDSNAADIDTDVESGYTDLNEFKIRRYETYRPIALRVVRFFLVLLAVIALALALNVNVFHLSTTATTTGKIIKAGIDVVIALLLADLVWVWAKSAIDRRLADYVPPEDGQAPGPEARMATLLPLLRTMLMVTLLIMAILTVLSSFGVNIGPLLAGAGVIGVAVGFGAQALVRDVVSGIFFLIDDAFRIGEYVEIDSLRGTVESMSVRSLRIRHHRGAVHTIPFGELKSLTNYSRDWVIMKMEFRVPFDTDLKLVKKLVKQIGTELQQHPDYGHSIIQPLKSQGVRRMEEFNMVVGVKFMAKPGEQWMIRRDAYQRVRDAFDANGIVFAERNVKVEVLNKQPMDKETEDAVVGAVQDTLEQGAPPTAAPDEP